MTDEAAMAQLRHGDPAGLDALYRAHFASLYRFAARQIGDRHAAEDIAQATFIRAFRYATSHRPGEPAGPWLFRIAYRLCLDHARRARREVAGLLPPAAEPAAPDQDRAELADSPPTVRAPEDATGGGGRVRSRDNQASSGRGACPGRLPAHPPADGRSGGRWPWGRRGAFPIPIVRGRRLIHLRR